MSISNCIPLYEKIIFNRKVYTKSLSEMSISNRKVYKKCLREKSISNPKAYTKSLYLIRKVYI